jgi:hypothetical protein
VKNERWCPRCLPLTSGALRVSALEDPMTASWRAVLPRHTAHQWRLTVSCEDGLCQLFTPRSQGGAPASGPDRSIRAVGPQIEIGPQVRQIRRFPEVPYGPWFASQTAPAGPNALKCPATASQHAAKHNDALHGGSPGPHRARNRRSARLT